MAASVSDGLMVLIENAVNGGQNNAVSEISKGIQEKRYKLLDVVEALGPYLTSAELQRRVEGIKLLTDVIQLLPTEWLNIKELGVLVSFMCDRLKDHHSIIPYVIKAASSLLRSDDISATEIHQMLSAISNEIHIQSLTQSERRCFYQMIEYLLTNRLADLQAMSGDFVFGYIQCMDGEKDPRNLVIAFNCVTIIATNLSLGPFVEDLFDVIACYFPVDFTPPSDNPHGITKAQLVGGLRRCLSSTSQFAEFCLPLLLEKLTSVIQSAKIDAFLTLAACSPVYGEKLLEFSGSLWSCIRKEVYAPMTEALEEAALTALSAMTSAVSKLIIPPGGSSLLDAFVQDIIQDVSRHLCDPEEKLIVPSSKLLRAVGSASNPACWIVFQEVLPLLLDQSEQLKQISDRKLLIQQIIDFLRLLSDWRDFGSNPALPFKERLYTSFILLMSHNSPTLCQLAVQGVVALYAVPGLLSQEELQTCSQHILLAVLRNDRDTRKTAVSALSVVCPHLMSDCIENICTQLQKHGETDNELCLEVMSKISSCLNVVKEVVPYYLSCLEQLSKESGDKALTKAVTISDHLYSVIQNTRHSEDCVNFCYDVVIPRVFNTCLSGALNCCYVFKEWTVVEKLAACVRVIVCHTEERRAQRLLLATISLFLDHDTSQFNDILPQDLDLSEFCTFSVEGTSCQTQLICLFTAVVCSQPVTVEIPRHTEILTNLLNLATRWQHLPSATTAAKCFAGLVNKLSDDIPGPSVTKLAGELISSPEFQQRAVLVLLWLTKALLMRNHPDQRQLVNALLGLLADPKLGVRIAEGFRILLEDSQDILTTEMHSQIQFMYKQRLFVFTVDDLTDGFRNAKQDLRLPYLVAVSYLLQYVPREAVMPYLPMLMPLMIQCLQQDGEDLWLSTLSTLEHMIHESPELLTTYLDDLLTHLLELTRYKSNMKVRIASLRCLCLLTSFPLHVLVPHQRHVTKKLIPLLDDHKRLVRRQAVLTREKWILIGAPGTD